MNINSIGSTSQAKGGKSTPGGSVKNAWSTAKKNFSSSVASFFF